MQFFVVLSTAILAATSAFADPLEKRTWPKINEYPKSNCLNNDGSNNPTWGHHSPSLSGCIEIDGSTNSVYVTKAGKSFIGYFKTGCPDDARIGAIQKDGECVDVNNDYILQGGRLSSIKVS